MADFNKPVVGDLYTAILTSIRNMFADLVIGVIQAGSTNVPTGAISWSNANKRWEKWSGTAWSELVAKASDKYDINVDRVDGYDVGNANGNIPLSNGTVNTNLNADYLRGAVPGVGANNIVQLTAGARLPTAVMPTASEITFTPTGGIAANTVAAALAELDSEKLSIVGGTITSDLVVSPNATVSSTTIAGSGSIELFRAAGAYIDFKNAQGDDYDVRITQSGSNAFQIIAPGGLSLPNGFLDVTTSVAANAHAVAARPSTAAYSAIFAQSQNGGVVTYISNNSYGIYTNGVIQCDGNLLAYGNVIYMAAGAVNINWSSANSWIGVSHRMIVPSGFRGDQNGFVMVNTDGLFGRVNNGPGYIVLDIGGSDYGIPYQPSDAQLKENVAPTKVSALEKIAKFKFVEFTWNENSFAKGKKRNIGLIAQDLEEIDPETILQVNEKSYRQLNQETLLMYALKGLQEYEARVAALEKQIALMKAIG
jgi:hypothetical protein